MSSSRKENGTTIKYSIGLIVSGNKVFGLLEWKVFFSLESELKHPSVLSCKHYVITYTVLKPSEKWALVHYCYQV